jgi:hypothetical protein
VPHALERPPLAHRLCHQPAERDFFIDTLLVRVHFIVEMIWWTGLAPWECEFPFEVALHLPSSTSLHSTVYGVRFAARPRPENITSSNGHHRTTHLRPSRPTLVPARPPVCTSTSVKRCVCPKKQWPWSRGCPGRGTLGTRRERERERVRVCGRESERDMTRVTRVMFWALGCRAEG